MKFGIIVGEKVRREGMPPTPVQVVYPDFTTTVTEAKIILNGHSLSKFDTEGKQRWFKVPPNVRIFTYSRPGKHAYLNSYETTFDICANNNINEKIVLIYEPGDKMPQVETSVTDPILNMMGQDTNPYYAICFKEPYGGFKKVELNLLPFVKEGIINLSDLIFTLAENKNYFINFYLLACQSYPSPDSKPSFSQLMGELASTNISWTSNEFHKIGPENKLAEDTSPIGLRDYAQQLNQIHQQIDITPPIPWGVQQPILQSSVPWSSSWTLPPNSPNPLTSQGTSLNPGFAGYQGPGFTGYQGPGFSGQPGLVDKMAMANKVVEYIQTNINDLSYIPPQVFYEHLLKNLNIQNGPEIGLIVKNTIDKLRGVGFGKSKLNEINKIESDIKYLLKKRNKINF